MRDVIIPAAAAEVLNDLNERAPGVLYRENALAILHKLQQDGLAEIEGTGQSYDSGITICLTDDGMALIKAAKIAEKIWPQPEKRPPGRPRTVRRKR